MGYAQMAADGRIGGEPIMEEEDMDIELTIEDLNVMDDEEPVGMSSGGMYAVEPGKLRNKRGSVNSGAQAAARSMAKAGIRNMSGAGSKNYKAAQDKAQSIRDKNRKDRADRRRLAALEAAKQAAAQQATTQISPTLSLIHISEPTRPY